MFIVFLITLLISFLSIGFYLGSTRTFNKIFNSALIHKASHSTNNFEITFGNKRIVSKLLSVEEGKEAE